MVDVVKEFKTLIVDVVPVASAGAPVSPRTFFYVKKANEDTFQVWRSSDDGTEVWPQGIERSVVADVVKDTVSSGKFFPNVVDAMAPITEETFELLFGGAAVGDGVLITPNQQTWPDTRINGWVSAPGVITIEVRHTDNIGNSLMTDTYWTCTVIKASEL